MFLVVLNSQIFAGTNDTLVSNYMPFLNGEAWPRAPITAYIESASNIWVHPSAPKKFPTIREVHEADSDFTTVVMRLPDGSIFKTYNNFVLGPYLSAVYSGDFNNDGIADFMAIKPGSGNGLAGEYCTGIFAFSTEREFRFTRIRTMGLGPHNLVVDPKTKTFRLIHTSFRSDETLDGRSHSFWVHRFFKWENESFQSDSNLSPVWIQYLNRPNHEPTKLLTSKMKAKIWIDDPETEFKIEW